MKRVVKWFSLIVLAAVIIGVVALWTPDTDRLAMRTKYGAPPSQFLDVGGGLTVHVRDEGPRDAPVVVLLHGSNADLHTWDAWTNKLKDRYRIVRFDQMGHGLTGPSPTRDYRTAAFVDVVERVTSKLEIGRFTLVGNSMGGGIAWNYAVAHPDRLTGLVLIDAGGAPDLRKQSLPLGFLLARTPVLRDAIKYLTPRSLIENGLQQSVSNQAIVTPTAVDRYWELLRYPGNRQATIDRASIPPAAGGDTRVSSIKTPTLILWGADDKLLPVSGATWFRAHIPGSKVIIYRGIGHLPMEEAADSSANDVANWLATETPKR
jgi:pimeloyl-ACP methyl ester carboxylesterase